MLKGKIIIERINNNLEEIKMKELKIEVKAEIEISKKIQNKVKNLILIKNLILCVIMYYHTFIFVNLEYLNIMDLIM